MISLVPFDMKVHDVKVRQTIVPHIRFHFFRFNLQNCEVIGKAILRYFVVKKVGIFIVY